MKITNLLLSIILLCASQLYGANTNFTMLSPDGKLKATIDLKDKIYYSLALGDQQIMDPSPISMTLTDGSVWGKDPIERKNKARNVDE